MNNKFRVELVGCFYTYELYDDKGAEVFDLEIAAELAERDYGSDWGCVYNGMEGIERGEWIESQASLN